jgi:hypothetical protein
MPEIDTPVADASWSVVVAARPVKPCNWKLRRGSKMRIGSEGIASSYIPIQEMIPFTVRDLMTENILKILGVAAREDAVTNLLAYCFNTIPAFRQALLGCINISTGESDQPWQATTRVNLPDSGIPDLVLFGSVDDDTHIVIIENKLKADEGEGQTVRYSSAQAVELLRRRFGFSGQPTYVFLTLFPDQEPRAGSPWGRLTHRDIREAAFHRSIASMCVGSKLLSDWFQLVDEFYSFEAVKPDDLLMNRLQADSGLEGNYLYFMSFVQGLTLPAGLILEDWFRESRTGRRYFGAVISKPQWHPAEMTPDSMGNWHLDPARHFNVHIEPQFNIVSGVLNVYVHYEINPYQPEHWFRASVSEEERRTYAARRERFINAFAALKPRGIAIGGGCNQIAKMTCDFRGRTARETSIEMEEVLKNISVTIDDALSQLDATSHV